MTSKGLRTVMPCIKKKETACNTVVPELSGHPRGMTQGPVNIGSTGVDLYLGVLYKTIHNTNLCHN